VVHGSGLSVEACRSLVVMGAFCLSCFSYIYSSMIGGVVEGVRDP